MIDQGLCPSVSKLRAVPDTVIGSNSFRPHRYQLDVHMSPGRYWRDLAAHLFCSHCGQSGTSLAFGGKRIDAFHYRAYTSYRAKPTRFVFSISPMTDFRSVRFQKTYRIAPAGIKRLADVTLSRLAANAFVLAVAGLVNDVVACQTVVAAVYPAIQ